MLKTLTALALLFSFFTANAQRIKEIIVEVDTAGRIITYGSSVNFKFYIVTKKKRKEVTWNRVDKLISFTAMNPECSAVYGKIGFPAKTTNKNLSGCQVKVNSYNKDTKCDYTFDIKMNFKEPISAMFQGNTGMQGAAGSNGTMPILFRNGKDGEPGGIGGDGFPGKNITVKIKKEFDAPLNKEIFYIYVIEETTGIQYIYHCPYPEKGLTISSMGGQGGNGGNGGSGSSGKDAKEDKSAGNGGNGGPGGVGGKGGPGGKVTVIVHTNASEIMSYLNIISSGGPGGYGGVGGSGGSGGAGGGTQGSQGRAGESGVAGEQGPAFELRVEEF
ncbi:MAG TPA: hypothetical protein VK177_08020 [Flavobacteriales bacterium]|nr:hypothetical protein [Flavobacteriales bacterium]